MQKGPSTGLILGKFMPPHLGHRYLVNFANNFVDELIIVISTNEKDSIPGVFRKAWMEELFPLADIIIMDKNENIHTEGLRQYIHVPVDYVFASEEYGHALAQALGARFIPVDINRDLFPVSSSAIREQPQRHWNYLPECVKPFYLKKICLYGPNHTGKTELAQQLAKTFDTYYVSEFSKVFSKDYREIDYETYTDVARGQLAAESALSTFANKILICDTNVLLLKVFCEQVHGKVPEILLQLCEQTVYHLMLVPNIINADADSLKLMRACIMELEHRGIKYIALNGSTPKRLNKAMRSIRSSFPGLEIATEDSQDFVLLGNR